MTLFSLRSLLITGFWLATGTQALGLDSIEAGPNSARHSPLPPLGSNIAQADNAAPTSACPTPALSRLGQHRTQPGETLESLARRYNLIPATLIGMNPVLRQDSVPVGSLIVIPPYNGIQVNVPSGQSLQEIAAAYNVRADVLFEVNGCQTAPQVVFIPGVNGSPNPASTPKAAVGSASVPGKDPYRYPLPTLGPVLRGYGWQIDPKTGEVAFHGGVDLAATAGTQVLSSAEGTVAFAGDRGDYGNLVVVNHSSGGQTRYAQLATITVSVGQRIKQGAVLGTVGATGSAEEPQLHFEVRTNSAPGWVAQDPSSYFETLRGFKQIKSRPPQRPNSGL